MSRLNVPVPSATDQSAGFGKACAATSGTMLLLLFLAETVSRPPVQSATPASTSVRIHRSVRASEDQWNMTPPENRRELRRKDENGRMLIMRVIEHQ